MLEEKDLDDILDKATKLERNRLIEIIRDNKEYNEAEYFCGCNETIIEAIEMPVEK